MFKMAIILYATPICGRLQGILLMSLDWVIMNNYLPVNSEKKIFKKTNDYIIHGLFVDDMMHISWVQMDISFIIRNCLMGSTSPPHGIFGG
jgi:hypothetical protein